MIRFTVPSRHKYPYEDIFKAYKHLLDFSLSKFTRWKLKKMSGVDREKCEILTNQFNVSRKISIIRN